MNKLKQFIKKYYFLVGNSIYDYVKYTRNYQDSVTGNCNDLGYLIIKDAHRIEKAFSLPETRVGFGQSLILSLCKNVEMLGVGSTQQDKWVYDLGYAAIKYYFDYHSDKNYTFSEEMTAAFNKLPKSGNTAKFGLIKPDVDSAMNTLDFQSFAKARYSSRMFSNKIISSDLLTSIVELTMTAPSVCNRQHWKVHVFTGKLKEEVLSYQNGNRGFTDDIPYVALVTSDISAFYTPHERNQAYIDGGIFLMNLLYSMQFYGVNSCPLNWCTPFNIQKNFDSKGYTPKNEVVICAIAFGHPKPNSQYAISERNSVDSVLTTHQ